MAQLAPDSVRRRFVAWVVTVAVCAATVSAEHLVSVPPTRIAGIDLSGAWALAPYVALLAVVVMSVRWLRALKARPTRPITVRELRELAGRH